MKLQRPVLLVFILLSLVAAAAPQPNLDSFKGCGLRGTASSSCGKALNRLKNRYVAPTSTQINPAITLKAILAPGNDAGRWSTSDGATIVGYIASVLPGGKQESCNCGKTSLRDIHINVVEKLTDVGHEERYVVVEITPRLKSLNPTWTDSWAKTLEGKRVRITGWMLFDGMHSLESSNTKDESHQRCGSLEVEEIWRATGWEVHPVTSIEVL